MTVKGKPQQPHQFPYIRLSTRDSPESPRPLKWAQFYIQTGEGKILMAQKVVKDEKEILQDSEGWRKSPTTIMDDDPTNQFSCSAKSLPTENWPEAGKHPSISTFTSPPDSPTGCRASIPANSNLSWRGNKLKPTGLNQCWCHVPQAQSSAPSKYYRMRGG